MYCLQTDTTILCACKNIVNDIPVINKELSKISNWFKVINASKTNYIIMGTPRMTSIDISNDSSLKSNGGIILDDIKLQRVLNQNQILTGYDKNLSWKILIDGISKTMSRNIGVINKVNDILCLEGFYTHTVLLCYHN